MRSELTQGAYNRIIQTLLTGTFDTLSRAEGSWEDKNEMST